MGMVLERCISEDLNRKMANSWQDEPKNRYKQLLTGALMDGEVRDCDYVMLVVLVMPSPWFSVFSSCYFELSFK